MDYITKYPSSTLYPSTSLYPFVLNFDILEFLRTPEDVAYCKALHEKIKNGTATQAERAEWNAGYLKGAYNYTDLNRVGHILNYIKDEGEPLGFYITYPHEVVTNWTSASLPTVIDVRKLLDNVETVRTTFAQWITTNVPTEIRSYMDADTLEYILWQVKFVYNGSIMAQRHSGEIYAGGNY